MDTKIAVFASACCVISVTTTLLIILSFRMLEYNEYGLSYNAITKYVAPKAYPRGIYFLGIAHSFIKFPTTVQTFEFSQSGQADAP